MDSGGTTESCVRFGPDPPREGAIFKVKDMLGMPDYTAVTSASYRLRALTGLPSWSFFGICLRIFSCFLLC